MKKILVLGDSTSSAMGGESSNWLKIISAKPVWGEGTKFIDTSSPGMTAGSAFVVLLSKLLKERGLFSVVILSVGNCDRILRPYRVNEIKIRKLVRLLFFKIIGGKHRVKHSWAKLDLLKWVDNEPLSVSQSVDNFGKALRSVYLLCRIFRIPLIIIGSNSNLNFPPGTSKNNSLFYSILLENNLNVTNISSGIPRLEDYANVISDSLQNDAEFTSEIEELAKFSTSRILCAVNNFAVELARKGELEYALEILHTVLDEQDVRKDLIHFNIGLIYLTKRNLEKANYYFELSRNHDEGSYRANTLYMEEISRIFHKKQNAILIDMKSENFSHDYLDHCHLLPNGQEKIANLIYEALRAYLPTGNRSALLRIEPANPEILEGDLRGFNSIFGLIADESDNRLDIPQGRAHSLECVMPFFENYPIRTKFIEILESSFFIFVTNNELTGEEGVILEAISKERARVHQFFEQLEIQVPEFPISHLSKESQVIWLQSIVQNLKSEVTIFLVSKINSVFRLRSIMNWYFRESLYFGFNSSHEMLFDRGQIRAWKEALAIAHSLDNLNSENFKEQISNQFLFIIELESKLIELYEGKDAMSNLTGILGQKEAELSNDFMEKWSFINE